MYLTVAFMVIIGLFPLFFINALQRPVNLFTHDVSFNLNLIRVGAIDSLKIINWLFAGFILFVLAVLGIRKYLSRKKVIESGPTWGCGYSAADSKLQYTASSFVRSHAKLAKPLLEIEKKEVEIAEVFPSAKHYETDSYDKIERILIDKPIKATQQISPICSSSFRTVSLQRYILYGIIFITAVLVLPMVIDKILTILHFLNNL